MRTIKFKGKVLGTNDWAYGDLIHVGDNIQIRTQAEDSEIGLEYHWLFVDPETVGQFTGLLDKNGKEIFEGDKIRFFTFRHPYKNPTSKGITEVVVLNEESVSFYPMNDLHYTDGEMGDSIDYGLGFEIIGNIHEN